MLCDDQWKCKALIQAQREQVVKPLPCEFPEKEDDPVSLSRNYVKHLGFLSTQLLVS